MRTFVALGLAALCVAAGAARADGDPASDVLYTSNTYLPYDAPPASATSALRSAVESAYARHFRVKVAVIATQVDLGSVPSLWGKPTQYAKFLGTELETFYVGPLLIVMPQGFGIYDGGRSVAGETKVLAAAKLKADDSEGLTRAAADAVTRLLHAGALRSKDVKAPFAYAFPTTVHRGQVARFKFGVSDDSAWSKTTARITVGSRTIATLRSKLVRVSPSKPVSLTWKVPKRLRAKGLRVCVSASDAAGNRSPKSCGALVVR
jgi:hypothetical protein